MTEIEDRLVSCLDEIPVLGGLPLTDEDLRHIAEALAPVVREAQAEAYGKGERSGETFQKSLWQVQERHLSYVTLTVPFTGDVVEPEPPACGMPSPSGSMLCDLPATGGLPHHFEQHLGIDRHGNFRGWADKRGRG